MAIGQGSASGQADLPARVVGEPLFEIGGALYIKRARIQAQKINEDRAALEPDPTANLSGASVVMKNIHPKRCGVPSFESGASARDDRNSKA